MLKITIPEMELYDEVNERFVYLKETPLTLEHSLVSISKWESKYHKPFLKKDDTKTREEVLYYIQCMTLTQNVNPDIYKYLPDSVLNQITEYIEDPMTATWFNNSGNSKPSREIITSELIYYWMTAYNIPAEYQKWHINRLLTLIKICNVKNSPEKKMSKGDQMREQQRLNAERRARLKSKG